MFLAGNRRPRHSARFADSCRLARPRGFSLVELVVVLALAALAVGAGARALAERNPGPALVASQQLVAAVLTAARVEALASGATTRVLVPADHPEGGEPEFRLRQLQVVSRQPDGTWRAVTRRMVLPRPALVVPPSPPPLVSGALWGSAPVSSFAGEATLQVVDAAGARQLRACYVEFSPRGTSLVATVVLAPGENAPPSRDERLRFREPRDVRGVKLSQYGAQTLLDHADAF